MKLRRPIPIRISRPFSFKTGLKTALNLSLILGAQKICAQLLPAADFFDTGAQLYISNNIPAALTNVEQGLQIYPNDEKLQKLEKLLKQQQQKNQRQKNQQNQNQQNQKQQSKNDKNSQSKNQPDKNDRQNQQPQNAAKQNQDEQKNGETNGAPQKVMAGQMTPEDAKRLLDQQKDNEQILMMKPNAKPPDASHPVKDW